MTFTFKPANSFTERAGLFVSLTGSTNSGKTFSALRLARGIAGPNGKIAVLDTEGGRTLHLKREFGFDANLMDPPFHPQRFADAAKDAEDAGYACMLIDSFSMEWVGLGGVLDWQAIELEAMVARTMARKDNKRPEYAIREASKMASWIKPKSAHKTMVYSLLQRRLPIVFAIRGEETTKPGEAAGERPTAIFKSICNKHFPFEVTVSFRLDSERKGYIDLSDPKSWKMEGSHQGIFLDGDRISEDHGKALAEWACGKGPEPKIDNRMIYLQEQGDEAAAKGKVAFAKFWNSLEREQRVIVGGTSQRDIWIDIAKKADETPRATDDDMDLPDDFDNQSSSLAPVFTPAAERDEAAAGSAFPVERRAEPTNDLEGSAPDPQERQSESGPTMATRNVGMAAGSSKIVTDVGRSAGVSATTTANQSTEASVPPDASVPASPPTRTQAGAEQHQPPAAVSAPAISPTPPREPVASDNDDPDSPEAVARDRDARVAAIKIDGAAAASKGEVALNNFLEGLVASGERSMIENATVREWRRTAREVRK